MKRFDLSNGFYDLLGQEDIRPSILKKIHKSFIKQGIYNVSAYCQKTEDELLLVDGMDEKILGIMKKKLAEYGLSLGMTPEELADYEDAEYYERHPEERPGKQEEISESESEEIASKDFEEMLIRHLNHSGTSIDSVLDNEEPTTHENPVFVPLTDGLKARILSKHEEILHKRFKDYVLNRGAMKLMPDDIEFMRIHLFRTFFSDQPWYVRLFNSYDERISKAKKMADAEVHRLASELENDWVKVQNEAYAVDIETFWESNWQRYLKEIE